MAESMLKKQRKEYLWIAVFVFVALFIGINRFQKKDKDDEVFSRNEFNNKWSEVKALEAREPYKEKGVLYSTDIKRIPFKGPFDDREALEEIDTENITLPAINLQGMVWNSRMPQAIIDNKVYGINDVISEADNGIKIEDITSDGVHLRYKGRGFIVSPSVK